MTYTVTCTSNGGTGTMANETYVSGQSQALTANGFSNPGFTFGGWSAGPDGSLVYFNHADDHDLGWASPSTPSGTR